MPVGLNFNAKKNMRALADAITFRLLDLNYNLREEKLSFSFSFETQSLALPLCVYFALP